tara:strand:- start:734 stop:1129 length:396 start_codon:yes stop_codon:yes gene_type:complete
MIALKKIWSFLKSYWYIPVLIIVALVFRSKTNKVEDIIKAADDSHKKQLEAINTAANEKAVQEKKIQIEYNDAVDAITNLYGIQKKALDKEKLNKIQKITKEYYNDKEKISQEIFNEFGFIYTPRKNNNDS